jgi:hypothetical protein
MANQPNLIYTSSLATAFTSPTQRAVCRESRFSIITTLFRPKTSRATKSRRETPFSGFWSPCFSSGPSKKDRQPSRSLFRGLLCLHPTLRRSARKALQPCTNFRSSARRKVRPNSTPSIDSTAPPDLYAQLLIALPARVEFVASKTTQRAALDDRLVAAQNRSGRKVVRGPWFEFPRESGGSERKPAALRRLRFVPLRLTARARR